MGLLVVGYFVVFAVLVLGWCGVNRGYMIGDRVVLGIVLWFLVCQGVGYERLDEHLMRHVNSCELIVDEEFFRMERACVDVSYRK